MKYLHKYVPNGQNDDPYPILIHGDQLSVERMVEAKLSMAFSEDQADQLTGLVPRPQGFHKRCFILQYFMNMLFSGSTVGYKGSLYHIKNKFGFRSVKKKISDCVNSVVDFFNFVTEASICLIVCNILHIDNIDELSDSLPEDEDGKQKMFEDICRSVVKLVKPQFDVASIQQAAAGDHENVQNLDYDDDDSQSLDDTILYWNDGTNEFEDTLPYYEDSEDEFGMNS